MKLSVHVGLHKTGTTTIQKTLELNRDTLHEAGILYPKASSIRAGGHLNLVWELTSPWKFEPSLGGLDALVDEVREAQPEHVIVSAESLSGFRRRDDVLEVPRRLAEALGAEAHIVATVRPQFLLLDSLYAQNASTGYADQPYEEWLLTQIAEGNVDLEALLGRWFDAYPDVSLIPVEPSSADPLVETFLRRCGVIKAVALEPAPRANTRTSIRAVEFGRVASRLLQRTGTERGRRHEVIRELRRLIAAHFPEDPAFAGMTRETALFVHRVYAQRNETFFARRVGGEVTFSVTPEDQRYEKRTYNLDTASVQERETFEALLLEATSNVLSK
ncbi:hypothetical protein [uncultured Serinicoccus sp.]|uniref:hypothetical protein n=1 Tax=uncultured Serinicoccus sp. TaxID=735514 RepID=UPI00260FF998|nr:hypothetical protein [uncultured Serinicoccus sp.]